MIIGIDGSVVFVRHSGRPLKVHRTMLRNRHSVDNINRVTASGSECPKNQSVADQMPTESVPEVV